MCAPYITATFACFSAGRRHSLLSTATFTHSVFLLSLSLTLLTLFACNHYGVEYIGGNKEEARQSLWAWIEERSRLSLSHTKYILADIDKCKCIQKRASDTKARRESWVVWICELSVFAFLTSSLLLSFLSQITTKKKSEAAWERKVQGLAGLSRRILVREAIESW